jgi:TonB-linked SusC/RagA family outer membrane protein
LVRTFSPTVSGALVGKLPGISARSINGRPGSSTDIQIRNLGSPLFVIDGVTSSEGNFNNLDANDIESISVLKDASASIYGVQAANGVVLITTKSGKRNTKSQINGRFYTGISNPQFTPNLANAATYYRGKMEEELNGMTTDILKTGATSKEQAYTTDKLNAYQNGTLPSTDWYKFIVQQNARINYGNVSSSGGSENIGYYFSLSHIGQEGMFKEFDFMRTNMQANIDASITQSLKVGIKMNGRIETRSNPSVAGVDDYWVPVFSLYQTLPTYMPYANNNPEYIASSNIGWANPPTFRKNISGKLSDEWIAINPQFFIEYKLPWIKGLTWQGTYSIQKSFNTRDNFDYKYYTYTYNPKTAIYLPTVAQNASHTFALTQVSEQNILSQLSYSNTFGKHTVSGMAVWEAYDSKLGYLYNKTNPTTNQINLLYTQDFSDLNNIYAESARAGLAFRANYNYDNRYYAEFGGRYDATYLFPKKSRWGFFPSFSAGWRISNEKFMQKFSSVLSNLKIRSSYGQMGDSRYSNNPLDNPSPQIVAPFSYIDGYTYNVGSAVLNNEDIKGIQFRGMPVTNLSWINSSIFNIGIDFGFLSDKLTGSAEYFYRKRSGIPAVRNDVLIPAEVNLILPPENLNSDATLGTEFSLLWKDKVVKDFNYQLGGNFSFARRMNLTSYNPLFSGQINRYFGSTENRWSNISWAYECIGQFQSLEEIRNYPVDIDGAGNSTILPGDPILKDVNNDGIIAPQDMRPLGYAQAGLPYINFGATMLCSWKGIDLRADFAGASGQTMNFIAEQRIPFMNGTGNAPARLINDAWHHADPSDVNSSWVPGKYPAIRYNIAWLATVTSSFWMKNVTYLKLKTLELGYTLPKEWTKSLYISDLRIFANAYNVFCFSNLDSKELDPEIVVIDPNSVNRMALNTGIAVPNVRVYNIGININF